FQVKHPERGFVALKNFAVQFHDRDSFRKDFEHLIKHKALEQTLQSFLDLTNDSIDRLNLYRRECVRLLILKIQDPKNSPSQLDWYAQFGCGPCCDTNELLSFFAAIIDVFQDHRLLLLTGTPQQSGIESLCVVVRKRDAVRSAPGLRQNAETPA